MTALARTGPVTLTGQVCLGGRALFPPIRLELAMGEWTAILAIPASANRRCCA